MASPAAILDGPKGDSQYVNALRDFFHRYQLKTGELQRDILDRRYQLQLSVPLPEFDKRTARAFAISDTMGGAKSLFALVCHPGTMQRHNLIQPLKMVESPYLMRLVAAGWVPLSQPEEERFVIVYERPVGKKLSSLIAEGQGTVNENFLSRNIIAPLASAIDQLAQLGLAHGSVCPDNIYFNDMPVLGDCISAPCGYDQPFQFDPLERMQALPAGKGAGSAAQDYYALAVTVLTLFYGSNHFANMTPAALMSAILREGTYAAMTRNKAVPEVFDDFFRGLLCANAKDRWSYAQIKPWLDGKRFNMLMPPSPAAGRPFESGEIQATTRRELAHVLYANWNKIFSFLENSQLTQWITVSLRNKELAEAVQRIGRSAAELAGKNEAQFNEQLMRLLMLLDPDGPIRISTLSMHADGIDALCADLFIHKSEKELMLMARFIEFNMINFWLDLQRKDPAYVIPDSVNTMLIKLERLRLCIRNTGYGFGIERMLYELNPEMPCQSHFFVNHQVASLPALLATLDQLAPSLHNNEDPLDRHIAAFIASKASIQHEIKLHELAALPALAAHRAVIALKLLATAQQKTDNLTLPGLTHWLALRIAPALEHIRSRTLRNRLKASLAECARSGSLPLLSDLIINPSYAAADQDGFSQAKGVYQMNVFEILGCRKGDNIDRASDRLGMAMAKLFAFLALGITLFSVFKGGG